MEKYFGHTYYVFNIEKILYSLQNAIPSPDTMFWKEVVNYEINSVISNNTWKFVELSPGCTTIGCKWMLKKKRKSEGIVDKFNARLVARCFK